MSKCSCKRRGNEGEEIPTEIPTSSTLPPPNPEIESRSSRNRSDIFIKHFTKSEEEFVDTKGRTYRNAICNHCGQPYMFRRSGGYGTFKAHLIKEHAEIYEDTPVRTQKSGSSYRPHTQSHTQSFARTQAHTQLFALNEENYTYSIARYAAVEHITVRLGGDVNFLEHVHEGSNRIPKSLPRANSTLSIRKQYKYLKGLLINSLTDMNTTFSISMDIWNEHWQEHSFLGVTCHWIDENFKCQKRLLSFRTLGSTTEAKCAFKLLNRTLMEYNITQKIYCITFPVSIVETTAPKDLIKLCTDNFNAKFYNASNSVHFFNKCAEGALKTVHPHLGGIIKVASLIWKHTTLLEKWLSACKKSGLEPSHFTRSVAGNWNTTYKMLMQVLPYRNLFTTFAASELNVEISLQDWVTCDKIVDILGPFHLATKCLVDVYHPTNHLLLHECYNIITVLCNYRNDPLVNLRQVVFVIYKIWREFFIDFPRCDMVACFLDPRVKMEGLKEDLLNYLLKAKEIAKAGGFEFKRIDVDRILSEVHNHIRLECNDASGSSSSDAKVPTASRYAASAESIMQRHARRRTPSAELPGYLTTEFEFIGDYAGSRFDILEWWRGHALEFPTLGSIARRALAIPLCITYLDRAFLKSAHSLGERRSSTIPKQLQEQTCLDDWVRAANQTQHQSPIGEDWMSSPEVRNEDFEHTSGSHSSSDYN